MQIVEAKVGGMTQFDNRHDCTYTVTSKSKTCAAIIDDQYYQACEPGTIIVISVVSSLPEVVGACVNGKWVYLRRTMSDEAIITVRVSGVRVGPRAH